MKICRRCGAQYEASQDPNFCSGCANLEIPARAPDDDRSTKDYRCVMEIPTAHVLHSETVEVTCEVIETEGFTLDAAGQPVPNGIKLEVWKPIQMKKIGLSPISL